MKKLILVFIFLLLQNLNTLAEENKLSGIEHKYTECTEKLETEYDKCPESWSMKCYDKLIEAQQNAQACYKEIAVDLFVKYYGLSEKEAENRFDAFRKELYSQYFFVFSETNYCKKNNCGIGLYLYSYYVTTEQLKYYINKIIKSINVNL